jgi:uncharacterized protein YkwD
MPATLPQALGFLVGVWLALVLLTPLGARGDTLQGPGLAADAQGPAAPGPGLGRLEDELFATVNDWRAGRHLVGLARDPALDAVARRHSADMAARGYFAHDTPEGRNPVDRIMAGGVAEFTLAGENVGMTNRAGPNAEIFHGWLASRDHYENLSAPAFNATGVGIARRADGTLFYTQVYVTFPR